MGNTPSTTKQTTVHPASHESSKSHSNTLTSISSPSTSTSTSNSTRRDHPRNLIPSQRAAAAEASLTQARGTTATHRSRNSQSIPTANFNTSHSSPSQSISTPSHRSSDSRMGAQESKENKPDIRDQPTKPVDVPVPITSNNEPASSRSYSQSIEPSGPPAQQDMSYHLTRPPRLPLPIEEEVHTPGSPIIAPADVGADIDAPVLDIDPLDTDALPRRSSALSNTTIDEEDAEELRVDKTGATVPTVFEWKRGGDKVYVTGTIFQWNKKHRLHAVEGHPGLSRATINVRPGTHHIRFIVDSVMQCSQDIPTTVDFGNNLVNYIEVSADDLPQELPVRSSGPEIPPVPPEQKPSEPPKTVENDGTSPPKAAPKTKPALHSGHYSRQIPQYLVDLDKAEDSAAYQYAATAIEKLPTPPSLPGFLGKPILNAATPMKDDNSVLTMPNHTVLNHLATSSIKNNVLAVSVTTRYKRKYVTTIMYKPTGDD